MTRIPIYVHLSLDVGLGLVRAHDGENRYPAAGEASSVFGCIWCA